MPNKHFNNYNSTNEQELVTDLIVEAISIYGAPCYYVTRTLRNRDQLYGTDDISAYNKGYEMDMYVKNTEGFSGEGRFLSKFGYEVRDEITLTVARRTFENLIYTVDQTRNRPMEGDLIFFELNNKFYVIKYVQHESIFYQLGQLQVYDLVCESFEYSGEQFQTGIGKIDSLQAFYSTDMSNYDILLENGKVLQTEDNFDLILEAYKLITQTGIIGSDNQYIANNISQYLDFSQMNPFGESQLQVPTEPPLDGQEDN